MRIDKYLWCVRLYKTRSLAQDALRLGRVRVGGVQVKASYELKEGEIVKVVDLIDRVLSNIDSETEIMNVRNEVNALMAGRPLYAW